MKIIVAKSVINKGVLKIHKLIKKWEREGRSYMKEGDKETVSMVRGDIKDAEKVVRMVKHQEWKKLGSKLWDMDTHPREQIIACVPKKLWDAIEEAYF